MDQVNNQIIIIIIKKETDNSLSRTASSWIFYALPLVLVNIILTNEVNPSAGDRI